MADRDVDVTCMQAAQMHINSTATCIIWDLASAVQQTSMRLQWAVASLECMEIDMSRLKHLFAQLLQA